MMVYTLLGIAGLFMSSPSLQAHASEFNRLIQDARAPRLRTIREFAEQEIWLPDSGPHAGERFRCKYQPYTALWFDLVASSQFNRFVATGPAQSGKTLCALVIPLMYSVFELRETSILFAPKIDICKDKWEVDILPTIKRSRYADLLPRTGPGSQKGWADLITFRNGVRLKSMSGGGDDSGRAAFTAKAAFGTEINDLASASETSDESNPINQIAGRLRAHGQNAKMFLECTVATKKGIWAEYLAGSCSRLVLQCVGCFEWVTPERDDFVGWDAASSELEAESLGRFACPACGQLWTHDQRKAANHTAKIIHAGQSISPDGQIVGPSPMTRTASLRWSAVNNMFATEQQLGAEEWKAEREEDQELAQKRQMQQVWCLPWVSQVEASDLTPDTVASRLTGLPRCTVPADAETLVVQVDVHDRYLYWCAAATGPNSTHSVVDYGIKLTPNPDLNGTRQAVAMGLRQLRGELFAKEWKRPDGTAVKIDLALTDSGYCDDVVLEFVTEVGLPWRCSKGKGDDYRRPEPGTPGTFAGDHWHFSEQPACSESNNRKWWLAIAQTNHWLHYLQSGFKSISVNDDGSRRQKSIAIFGSNPSEHTTAIDSTISRSAFATQICAWRWGEKETKRQGLQMMWISNYGQDHWCDCLYGCLVADRILRACDPRFRPKVEAKPTVPQPEPELTERQRRMMAGISEQAERMSRYSSY